MQLYWNNSVLSIIATGGIISASTSDKDSSILLKSPEITIDGQTFFEIAWFRKPYSIVHGSPIEMNGTFSFEVPLSDNNKIYLSNIKFEGTYNNFQENPRSRINIFFSYDSWGINWSKVLLSPWNMLLVGSLLIAYIILYLKQNGFHRLITRKTESKKVLKNDDESGHTGIK
jgi:hypothetical protein